MKNKLISLKGFSFLDFQTGIHYFSIMKLPLKWIFFVLFPVISCLQSQTEEHWISIPLSFESEPSGHDSYVPYYRINRPKIILALSGGGSRGLAQIGALKVLEQHGIPVDGIVGTSMGAVVGGLYAVGYTAAELESLATTIHWDAIMHDLPPLRQLFLGQKEDRAKHFLQIRLRGLSLDIPLSYSSGQKLYNTLSSLLIHAPYPPFESFDNLHIPFRALATDLVSGRLIVLESGSLVEALRASMTIPLLFSPVEKDSMLLVDGGLVQNLPVSQARDLGGDLVIAIDTSSKLREAASLKAPWEIADQVTTIMHINTLHSQMHKADIVIQPELTNTANTDFKNISDIITAGEQAARLAIPGIETHIDHLDQGFHRTWYPVDTISIQGLRHLDKTIIRSLIPIQEKTRLSTDEIRWAGHSLYQSGLFRFVHARLDTMHHRLLFIVTENPYITEIRFSGNSVYADTVLRKQLSLKLPLVLNHQEGRNDIQALNRLYRDAGYSLARIRRIDIHDHTMVIDIDEGRIDHISYHGNERTHRFVLDREMPLQSGQLFRDTLMIRGIENIYSTGYFNTVHYQIEKSVSGSGHHLHMALTEHPSTYLQAGFRFDLERESRGFLKAIEDNFLGLGVEGSVQGLVGKRDLRIQGLLRTHRLYKSYLTARLKIDWQRKQSNYYQNHVKQGVYDESVAGGAFSMGYQMERLGTVFFELLTESIHLKPVTGTGVPLEKLDLVLLKMRSEVDTRDRISSPTSGKHHIFEYEMSSSFMGNRIPYFKFYSSMTSYLPLTDFIVLNPRISWGTSDQTTPFAKRYSLGGIDSFLGLREQELVGRRYFVINSSLRFRLPTPRWLESHLILRYDLGGIWNDYTRIEWNDFKSGIGSILTVKTILGPVRVGYGTMSDGLSTFYLSAGYDF